MIGGTVIETIVLADKVWVNTIETGEGRNGKCAVYVDRTPPALQIKPGDSLWWQGKFAYWTPFKHRPCERGGKCHADYDRPILRIGNSGVSRPKVTT